MNKISSTSEISSENYSVDLWIEVSRLRIALRAWQQELAKIGEHISMLERDVLARPAVDDAASSSGSNTDVSTATLGPSPWRESAIVAGRRMQKRLREIKTEYDLKIQECTMVLDGMALSTQLSWSQIGYQDTQANLEIAKDTRQDSSQMRSIAFLTMLFLPATFIASFFSTSFFNFQPTGSESVLSPYIWIYPVVTFIITAMVMACWYFFTKRRRSQVLRAKSVVDGEKLL
ncbi:hypothetical protein B0T16DRAFT_416705 [Cercophora newfieldiana]|uniref:Uncharacterized protein n=1 Tax=Cercophora newfieldiana TaxID=92897 RepID=A0AA39Y2B9_9PEZI|nr:hypothetical protein B0T16DRAFT_416705 [Cercophora newfieldiana]